MSLSRELNWRFFDITSGRANRRQFLIYLILYLVVRITTGYVLLAQYILFVGMLRRYRDSGIGNWLGITLIVVNVLPLIMWMLPVGKTMIVMTYYFASFYGDSFPYLSLVYLLIFFVPLFFASDPYPNAFGYPTIGFDIRTMHKSTYSQSLMSKYRDEEKMRYETQEKARTEMLEKRAMYKNKEKIETEYDSIMSVDVKPRK